jgi:photosystem II stability/assembly factor-like uncharacterized protein
MNQQRLLVATLAIFAASTFVACAQEPHGGPDELKNLKFRLVGPAVGGRVSRSCGVPGDPLTYYTATASGGVWKSSDGGSTWKPIFDEQSIASIGSIAVAPSDPNVIYVGSGEANIRGNVAAGNGIYKSTDAGKTWKHVWKQESQIGTMIVHPRNPDIAFAAVLGHAFGPNPERGVYRTTDGGQTWQRVLFNNADSGASDVCFDPSNPRILFAGLWQTRRRPWELVSGGPGSGLYLSRDGGDTWQQLVHKEENDPKHWGKGLPEGTWGKIGVAVAPSDGRRVYALIEAEKGGLYRSNDGGQNWSLASGSNTLRQRAWYYSTLTIDPANPDVVWCPQVPLLRSIDGGKTFARVRGPHHGDHHDIWIDPRNPRRIIDSNDGGIDISTNGGENWFTPHLPIAQFYHVAADNRVPYHVSGAMQDLGTASGPSNSLARGGIAAGDWHEVGGGEAGFTAPDHSDPNILYAGEYGGYISRYDHRTRQARNVGIYLFNISGHGAEDARYRFQWTAPILVSPHDARTIYHAANVLFKTTDGGQHWSAISGDLTRNDKTKQGWSGGPLTGDNTGAEYYCTIFALAESPKQKDLLWAGSDDGLVHVSRDGGKNWTNVTNAIQGLPQWGTVVCIEPSPHDAGTAYVVVDAHRLDNMRPLLWKTTDFGKSWKSLTTKLPQDVYLHAVREDPKRRGLLFVGTERGVAFSTDDGGNWQQLKLNLPPVAVHDLVVKNNDLVLGTHGRSIWIFDDLSPIREASALSSLALSPAPGGSGNGDGEPAAPSTQGQPATAGGVKAISAEAHLFTPQPATRWHLHSSMERGIGQNPPQGALLNYALKKKPDKEITLEITDSSGRPIATFKSKPPKKPATPGKPAEPDDQAGDEPPDDPDGRDDRFKKPELPTELGVNRFAWNLTYDGATIIKGAKIDTGEPRVGPRVIPGTYKLKLTIDGKAQTASLVVLPDPRPQHSASELSEQLQFALQVRDDITRLANRVQTLRVVRRQLAERNALLKDESQAEPLVKQSKELITKLDALEEKLHNPKAKVVYDILAQRGGAKLYSQLAWLYENAKDGDGAPTQGMREFYAECARHHQQYDGELGQLLGTDLAKINELAKKLEVPGVIVPSVKK